MNTFAGENTLVFLDSFLALFFFFQPHKGQFEHICKRNLNSHSRYKPKEEAEDKQAEMSHNSIGIIEFNVIDFHGKVAKDDHQVDQISTKRNSCDPSENLCIEDQVEERVGYSEAGRQDCHDHAEYKNGF